MQGFPVKYSSFNLHYFKQFIDYSNVYTPIKLTVRSNFYKDSHYSIPSIIFILFKAKFKYSSSLSF